MLLHTQPNRKDSPRFRTTLRGWRHRQHLILDRPRGPNGGYATLQEGAPCVLRFLREGLACACETQILTWDSHKNSPYLRARWPREVTFMSFRKCERVPLHLPCILERQDGIQMHEEVRDLSSCGCSIFSTHICAEGALLSISLHLPDGAHIQEIQGFVRNVRESKGGFLLGVEFLEGQEVQKNDLTFFVTTTLARRRTELEVEGRHPVVLVIDESIQLFESLRDPLKSFGFEAVWAGNVVDGMYRLRMLSPAAVLLQQESRLVSGVDVCRMIRGVKGLEELPVWLVGGAAADLPKLAKGAGAMGYFPPSRQMHQDIALGLAAALASPTKAAS